MNTCKCISKLEEMGFVERESVYENLDFVNKGWMMYHFVPNHGRFKKADSFHLNYCPACGGRLPERK